MCAINSKICKNFSPKIVYVNLLKRCLRLIFVGFIVGHNFILTQCGLITDEVSGTAHIAGGVVGAIAGILIIRNRKSDKWEYYLWYFALIVIIASYLVFIILNLISIFYPEFVPLIH